ncbi:hypothetical protein B0H19DRAFT_546413 [Mycena capillaripes]|nr:hypothetical protein B0H19DRAFT_546413 [Mycena capillaripes]
MHPCILCVAIGYGFKLLDAWTSSDEHVFLAIVAHYVTNDGKLRKYTTLPTLGVGFPCRHRFVASGGNWCYRRPKIERLCLRISVDRDCCPRQRRFSCDDVHRALMLLNHHLRLKCKSLEDVLLAMQGQ